MPFALALLLQPESPEAAAGRAVLSLLPVSALLQIAAAAPR